ncbi:MAG TPA: hypothetical protein DCR93_17845 [Cytophagales bacterium]|nr:hypothetical protein [Cytophagales bacterium]
MAFFTSGMHTDVVSRLTGVPSFRLIAQSTVKAHQDFVGDLKALGERMNATYVLQGTVRRWENQVRITAQLSETATNQLVWSGAFDGELADVFALQSDLASQITTQLQANLSPQEQQELEAAPTTVLAAYDDYLKARHRLEVPRLTYDDLQASLPLLESAVEADPKFYQAWALIIQVHALRYDMLMRVPEQRGTAGQVKEQLDEALAQAKALKPDGWEYLREQGFYQFYMQEDLLGAIQSFAKALEENPSDISTLNELAKLYTRTGHPEKAIEMLENSFELVQQTGYASYSLSFAYEMNKDYDKLPALLNRMYELYPEDKHYHVEAAYYQFLEDGSLTSFQEFKHRVETVQAVNPWDERALQNKEMVVAMFKHDFDHYHDRWQGTSEGHVAGHGGWMCPLVANDHLNHTRLLFEQEGYQEDGENILAMVKAVELKPVNLNSVCTFDSDVYMPKLTMLSGDADEARRQLEAVAPQVLNSTEFPIGAVERAVLLQAVDLILPDQAYYYYDLVVKNAMSFCSFESICADPWTYPNLMKDPRFLDEVRADGRFVEFLTQFGFLEAAS